MEPFSKIKSKAIPLDMVNIDTDQIIPKQFLKLISKTGYGKYLFYDWRFDSGDMLRQDFVLNNSKYNGRQILLTRDNFGSGSSREHAAWAIRDYGIKVIIATSFADIFYNNCFKSGILPVRQAQKEIDYLFQNVDTLDLEINLSSQEIVASDHENIRIMHFEVDGSKKRILLDGLDEIGITLEYEPYIAEYEKRNYKNISSFTTS